MVSEYVFLTLFFVFIFFSLLFSDYRKLSTIRAKDARIRRNQLRISFCGTFLCFYICFLIMILLDDQYRVREVALIPCSILAALIHYFVLSSLTWMGIEGLNIYRLINHPLTSGSSHEFIPRAALVGWGET